MISMFFLIIRVLFFFVKINGIIQKFHDKNWCYDLEPPKCKKNNIWGRKKIKQ